MPRVVTMSEILGQHPVLRGLDRRHLENLAGCSHLVPFRPGETIFRTGEPAAVLYLIRKGSVALELSAPGRGPLVIQTLGDGDPIGWSWLFPPHRWIFDAVARQPTRTVSVDAACLRRKCDEDHELGYLVMSRIANLVVETLQAARLQLLDVYGHVAAG